MLNSANPVQMVHQTHDALRRCEDKVIGEKGLTPEQYNVLLAIKSLKAPVRITDIALELVRSTNSVCMIADRMVKAGLLNRVREEETDRRKVYVSITDKAEALLTPAIEADQAFTLKILSDMPRVDKHVLLRVLATLRQRAAKYLDGKER